MTTLLQSEPKRLCSWLSDNHITPNNSKWLQENLAEMDSKFRAMIKIINEDADSFARRAETYYKNQPQLMRLIEDFYGAYRALAECCYCMTEELRLAHRTMPEAFPNKVYSMLRENHMALTSESPFPVIASSHLVRPFFNPGRFDFGFSRKGLKQLVEMFHTGEAVLQDSILEQCSCLSEDENQSFNVETELQSLKEALVNMEAEKDSVLVEYRQIFEKQENLIRKLEQRIFELSHYKEHQMKEITSLQEANDRLESEVHLLNEEIMACKFREVISNSELDKQSCDLELWEDVAESYYLDLQSSAVREALFESKLHELSGMCNILEDLSFRSCIEIQRMKDKICFLESENKGLENQLATYFPVVASLENNIASLEQKLVLHTKLHLSGTSKEEDILLDHVSDQPSCSNRRMNEAGNGKIILERLSSDAQELEILNLSVQELKRKMKTNKNRNSTKLSSQLQDVEGLIAEMVDVNTKLINTIKDSSSLGSVDSVELAQKTKVTQQARKEAERIGRLQLDVQRIKHLLIKLEDEKNESKKGKFRCLRSQTGADLGNFLYGHGNRSRKQRKVHICGCDSVDVLDHRMKKFVKSDT